MPLVIPDSLLQVSQSPVISGGSPSSSTTTSRATKIALVAGSSYCAAWGLYYLLQDVLRKSVIHQRKEAYKKTISDVRAGQRQGGPQDDGHHSELELQAVRDRFTSLSLLGRYVNPFPEWREQGVWEFVAWKAHSLLLKGRFWSDGGIGKLKTTQAGRDKLAKTLPVFKPEWEKHREEASQSTMGANEEASAAAMSPEESWHDLGKDDAVVNHKAPPPPSESIKYTWIGQSTFLITYGSVHILTDPVFSVQPVPSIFSPTRLTEVPCTIRELVANLSRLHVILISHNHFDHFDASIVPHIPEHTIWVVPKGMRKLLRSCGVQNDNQIREMDWWQKIEDVLAGSNTETSTKVAIQAVPALHWSSRGPLDTNQSLWCSYSMTLTPSAPSAPANLYFSGDTGYSSTYYPLLKHQLPHPLHLTFLPIGSYTPRWHMRPQHVSPWDSVAIANDIGAGQGGGKVIAQHWATWLLSDEPFDEPPQELSKALAVDAANNKGLNKDDWFVTVRLGETNEQTL